MAQAFHPSLDELPPTCAVFPLSGALLLPRGRLPLNIFEPRYLALVQDAFAHRRMFGMIQPDPNAPDGPTGPGLYRIGCLGRLSSFSETDDGRFQIGLTGLIRFTVAEELPMRDGFRRVRGDYSDFHADLQPDPPQPSVDRDGLLSALRVYFTARSVDANWDIIRRMETDMLVVTLCMICPFEPAEKQALLEAATDTDRAATLLTLLRIGAAEPEAPPNGRPPS